MDREEWRLIDAKVLKSHKVLLEYCNELAAQIKEIGDQFVILRERVQELEK